MTRKRSLLILASIAVLLLAAQSKSIAGETAPGQSFDDSQGNPFMEEVIDVDKAGEEEAQRKKQSKLDRHTLTPDELNRVGIELSPSGKIVPLLNRDGPPRQYGSRFTTSVEPLYPAYVLSPYPINPYGGGGFGFPNTGAPIGVPGMGMPFGFPGAGMPYGFPGMFPGAGIPFGFPGARMPFGFGSPFGFPGYGFPGSIAPFGVPFSDYGLPPIGGLWGQPYTNPFGAPPYSVLGPQAPSIFVPYSASYSWSSPPPGDPQNSVPQETQSFSSSGSLLSRPFWNGFAGRNALGRFSGGASMSLPTVTEYESTSTFTPIPPSIAP